MLMSLCWLSLMSLGILPAAIDGWDYNDVQGGSSWSSQYPQCTGSQQSPVNIQVEEAWYDRHLTAFHMPGYEAIPRNAHWELRNTGHAIQMLLNGDYILSEGGLEGSYKAAYLEFHWGKLDNMGSEHTVNGQHLSMECHVVHHSTACGSFDEALQTPKGIAVLSFLFKVHKVDNPAFKQIFHFLPNVTHKGESISLRPLPLLSLLPVNLNDYYRYEGSLTTPPCSENVVWTVFSDQIHISHKQLSVLRTTVMSTQADDPAPPVPLSHNCRAAQPLNGRTMYSSDPDHATVWSHPFRSPLAITCAVFCGMVILLALTRPYPDDNNAQS